MGPSLNRVWPDDTGDAVLLGASSRIAEAKVPGDPGPMPDFLIEAARQRHAERKLAAADDAPSIAPDQERHDAPLAEREGDMS